MVLLPTIPSKYKDIKFYDISEQVFISKSKDILGADLIDKEIKGYNVLKMFSSSISDRFAYITIDGSIHFSDDTEIHETCPKNIDGYAVRNIVIDEYDTYIVLNRIGDPYSKLQTNNFVDVAIEYDKSEVN
jgi:hypothetical protein